MDFLKLLMLLIVLAIFYNAYRHYKGVATKGFWQGYSAKGQFFTGVAFTFAFSSFYIADLTGVFYLYPTFMFVYLLLVAYSAKIELAAKSQG
ncbi:hypothetical protein RI845_04425 [Thalassotalea nanhaiensis]|uniref:Sodium:solute symporter n=1 Tax=Thalassotalea nanhaiensis TaxID=3065648 RepID=A0ABY9TLC3_9GAMM|nr:hypothetical protein RI845_04425 [Colwelliaceae bacterium SQ345]